jgi:hypothetical protein
MIGCQTLSICVAFGEGSGWARSGTTGAQRLLPLGGYSDFWAFGGLTQRFSVVLPVHIHPTRGTLLEASSAP